MKARRFTLFWYVVFSSELFDCNVVAENLTQVYDFNPIQGGQPLLINIHMALIDISELNLKRMEMMMETLTVLTWVVPQSQCEYAKRLVRHHRIAAYTEAVRIVIPALKVKYFWTPDLFFLEAYDVQMPASDRLPLSLVLKQFYTPQGKKTHCSFRFKQRHILKIRCPMTFRWFPVDLQTCTLNIRSFALDYNRLQMSWRGQKVGRPPPTKAVVVNPLLRSQQYDIEYSIYDQCSNVWSHNEAPSLWQTNSSEAGNYFKGVRIEARFYRRFMYQFVETYVPSFANVLTAFAAFWMSLDSSGDRISITTMTLLALYTQMTNARFVLPPCSYLTVCDLYLFMCMLSVLINVIECSVIQRIHKREQARIAERTISEPVKKFAYKRNPAHQKNDPALRTLSEGRLHWRPIKHSSAIAPVMPPSYRAAGQMETKQANWWHTICLPPPNKTRADHLNDQTKHILITLFAVFVGVYYPVIVLCRPSK